MPRAEAFPNVTILVAHRTDPDPRTSVALEHRTDDPVPADCQSAPEWGRLVVNFRKSL